MYWLANNIWTFGQQHYVFGKIEKEEEAKKQEALARRAANAPAPGKKPNRAKRPARELTESEGVEDAVPDSVEDSPSKVEDTTTTGGSAANKTPRPGARPNRKPKR
jgi:YidC/Oxa1 family membrane protein insertase